MKIIWIKLKTLRFAWYVFLIIITFYLSLILNYFFQISPSSKNISTSSLHSKIVTIGIDPGHGGIDSGTHYQRLYEKDLNLILSLKLAEMLSSQGYRVVLTRETDCLLTPYAHYKYKGHPYKSDDLQQRLIKLEAAKVDIIISIHLNWSEFRFRRGPIVFYSENSLLSQKIAQEIQDQFNQVQPYRKLTHSGDYYLLNHATLPIVLIELGYLSNQDERYLLQREAYQKKLLQAIINGLKKISLD